VNAQKATWSDSVAFGHLGHELSYEAAYFPALIFAHRARAPAAILALASGDKVYFFFVAACDEADFFAGAMVCPFALAHRAFWPAAILALAAGDMVNFFTGFTMSDSNFDLAHRNL
jgi:hypothetical protein